MCEDLQDAETLLDSKQVDLAVMHFPSLKENYVSVPVKKLTDILVCASQYSEMFPQRRLTVQQLPNYPIITYYDTSPMFVSLSQFMQDHGIDFKPEYQFIHTSSILRQIKMQPALAFLLKNLIEDELKRGELTTIDLEPELSGRYYYLIKPKNGLHASADCFAEYMTKYTSDIVSDT